jgi:biofilm protein TabA
MILDKIGKGSKYAGLSQRFARAFELLAQGDIASKEDGKYEVDGDRLFFMVQNYTTKPAEERRFESHRRYADIQAVYSGREAMGYCQIDGLEVTAAYDESKDIMFFATPDGYTNLRLEAGEFVVLFPDEAHMPQAQLDGPSQVRKIVFKVLID